MIWFYSVISFYRNEMILTKSSDCGGIKLWSWIERNQGSWSRSILLPFYLPEVVNPGSDPPTQPTSDRPWPDGSYQHQWPLPQQSSSCSHQSKFTINISFNDDKDFCAYPIMHISEANIRDLQFSYRNTTQLSRTPWYWPSSQVHYRIRVK